MSRTITALYDSRTDAEAARSRLTATNIDADNVRIIDQNEAGGFGSSSTGSSSGHGFWASIKDVFVPDEDRHSYDEGLRRGGVMLYASVDDDDVERAVTVLEETGSVDMDERENNWRSEGWAGYTPSADTSYGASSSSGATSGLSGNNDRSQEEHIQLAEEELRVGKREVNRGGARIRTYVTERPATEQVTLREEHVNVERRPIDGTTSSANLDNGALFQERTIEMTETAEEAVVDKRARVTEELVVSKTAEERTETISDTVRKTEVDIDETAGRDSSDRGILGGGSNDRDRF